MAQPFLIRTGHPQSDAEEFERHRNAARSQGYDLDVWTNPQGGLLAQPRPLTAPPPEPAPFADAEEEAPTVLHPRAPEMAPFVIRQGSVQADRQELDRARVMAAQQGYALETEPLTEGGLRVIPRPLSGPAGGPHVASVASAALVHARPPHASHPVVRVPSSPGARNGQSRCDQCGQGPAAQAFFMQNIGFLVLRFGTNYRGAFCRNCLSSTFWKTTLITSFFGWWGVISFVTTLVAIPTNITGYLRAKGELDRATA